MSLPDPGMVVLGRIAGSYGIQGWVRIQPFGDDPQEWRRMPVWWLSYGDSGEWQSRSLAGFKAHGAGWIAAFEGVSDRDGAEALKGWLIGAPREALPPPAEGEYYWGDLVGMVVINTAGELLGEVEGLIETGAHEVLRVRGAEQQERLLPFVDAVVLRVDMQDRQIQVEWELDW